MKTYIFELKRLSSIVFLKNMSIKINYSKKRKKSLNNLILFCKEGFKINNLKKYLSELEFSYVSDLLKTNDLKKFISF